MIQFTRKYPHVDLGFIPMFLSADNPKRASEQINDAYQHGGGWHPMRAFIMLPDGRLKYPEDPPLEILAEAKLRDETIRFYEHEWLAIIQPDCSFEASRLD